MKVPAMARTCAAVALLLVMASGGWCGEVKFTAGPTAAKAGEKVTIAFTASAPTDVEVAVLGQDGKVVRHLAAGVLGVKDPPPEPLKPGLAQSIEWDGRDDLGKPAVGGPLKVRVRLGRSARLEKYLGWNGQLMGVCVTGLAVGRDGEVFVLESDWNYGRTTLKAMDSQGKYLRTVIPYAAGTPKERAASVGQLEIDGERLPIVFGAFAYNTCPLTEGMMGQQNMAVHPDGHLVLASAIGTMTNHRPPRHLLALHREGGAPEGMSFVGPKIRDALGQFGYGAGERGRGVFDGLACSPDGKYVYLTQWIGGDSFKPRHGVFRVEWKDKGLGAPFLGKDEAGADDEHFKNPRGLAVDPAGNIYVCDSGNGRVMCFSSEGKLLARFSVEGPQQIGVHVPTGDVFVLSRREAPPKQKPPLPRLIRFSSPLKGEAQELAGLEADIQLMALDPKASPARAWVAISGGWHKPTRLVLIEEQGGKLQLGKDVSSRNGLVWPMFVAADPSGKRVLVRERWESYVEIDPEANRIVRSNVPGTKGDEVAFDRDGNIYALGGWASNKILRSDPSGKPLPFPGTGVNSLDVPYYSYGVSVGPRGLAVGLDGTVYASSTAPHKNGRLMAYGPDGKLKVNALIDGLASGDGCVGVDAAGNLYYGINRKPEKEPYPKGFMGKVPAEGWAFWKTKREEPWCYPYMNPYLYAMGAVFKFGPEGGKLGPDLPGGVEYSHGYLGVPDRVQGALWRYPGFGIVSASAGRNIPHGDPGCQCMSSRFAVDHFGRTYMPNPFIFSVEVLDSAGNPMERVGRYGNADDSKGIAFAAPFAVSVRGDNIYVSDSVNQRVADVKFEAAASAECDLR